MNLKSDYPFAVICLILCYQKEQYKVVELSKLLVSYVERAEVQDKMCVNVWKLAKTES